MTSYSSSLKIGSRSFAEVLDDLGAKGGVSLDALSRYAAPQSPCWRAPVFTTSAETGSSRDWETRLHVYADSDGPALPIPDPLDERAVAAELGLSAARTATDLARARRAFALHNHPDLFHPSLRALATSRMQLANMLLDRRRREIEAERRKR